MRADTVKGSLSLALTVLLLGCRSEQQAGQPSQPASPTAPAAAESSLERSNDFPTLARVEYVLQCMLEHGGQNYDTLYHCVCAADTLASKLSYDEFAQAQTFSYLYNTPGERGGEFRDPPQSKDLRTRLKEAKASAQQTCFPALPTGKASPK